MVDILGGLSVSEFTKLTDEGTQLKESHIAVRDPNNPRVAIIRTSDRISFKNCRRRWGWSSHLRHNLGPKYGISPLWFGTGIHFALEDFHGYNRFGHPKAAFIAFYKASKLYNPAKLPEDHEQLYELGCNMMDYYILWLQQRKNTVLKTYWHNGVPQVEVNFKFQIPWPKGKFGYDEVYYSGTIDRVCIDENDMLWPLDYKTAAVMAALHFLTDPQVGAYMWAAPHIYDKPIAGFIYQQHRKAVPNPGRLVYGGSKISTAKDQATTWHMYRQTMIEKYGSVELSPQENQDYLSALLHRESEWADDFIRIDRIYRNARSAQSEGVKILMEIEDMLNPDLPLYPNPTRDCGSFCPFISPCTSMDDGSDWSHELHAIMEPRESKYDQWRDKLVWPNEEKQDVGYGSRDWLDV